MSEERSTDPPIRYGEKATSAPDGPVLLPSLVAGDAPLELDIGFGRGRSFLARAGARITRVIGIEIKAKWAFRVEERRKRLGLDQALALSGDARELLARSGPDGCVARVFVHFPDPWWKKKHTKRRVVTESFLDTLSRLVADGGELYVQTDVEDRAEEYEALIAGHPAWAPASAEGYRVDHNPFGAESNREVRAAKDGLPVHRILARRVVRDTVA